jgi:hypothetical protein
MITIVGRSEPLSWILPTTTRRHILFFVDDPGRCKRDCLKPLCRMEIASASIRPLGGVWERI